MDFLSGMRAGLPAGLYHGLASYRHEVFVEMLGWSDLATPERLERDQFDRKRPARTVC